MSTFTFVALSALALAGNALGACTNPAVRKEYRTLSVAEKTEWVRALQCMAKIPHGGNLTKTRIAGGISLINSTSSLYDDWVYLHMDSNVKTHVTAMFFPWHRWYLDAFERDLKDKCQFKGTIPYWDFTKDVKNIPASPIFESDPTYGLGTWGTKESNWHVTDGAFAKTIRAYPVPHIIQRNYTPQPFRTNYIFPFEYPNKDKFANETATPEAIKYIIESFEGDFNAFSGHIEGPRAQGLHNAMHLSIGGDMSDPSPTPSDPLFWIYHAQLDRIWAKWQARRPANARSYSGGTIQVLELFDEHRTGLPWPPATIKDLMPVSGMEAADVPVEQVMSTVGNFTDRYTGFSGGRLCYTYDDMI
ncbi:tyrosinase [Ceratobasidium sp. AG-Ba]|nr:tyrosinase [Ceratobasidium sp. AG-Ba]